MKVFHLNTRFILLFIIQILFNLNVAISQEESDKGINLRFDSALALFNSGNYEECT